MSSRSFILDSDAVYSPTKPVPTAKSAAKTASSGCCGPSQPVVESSPCCPTEAPVAEDGTPCCDETAEKLAAEEIAPEPTSSGCCGPRGGK